MLVSHPLRLGIYEETGTQQHSTTLPQYQTARPLEGVPVVVVDLLLDLLGECRVALELQNTCVSHRGYIQFCNLDECWYP
jgi:hypothetical protein